MLAMQIAWSIAGSLDSVVESRESQESQLELFLCDLQTQLGHTAMGRIVRDLVC